MTGTVGGGARDRGTSAPTLAAFLPLRCRGSHDDRDAERARLLARSLAHFAAPGTFSRVVAATPPGEEATARAALEELGADVVDERELLPHRARYTHLEGAQIQMLLKLAFARATDATHYLLLDADCVAKRPMGLDTLIPGGKALLQAESRHVHPDWWKAASMILGVRLDLERPGMSVTPALFSTRVALGLVDRLDRRAPWRCDGFDLLARSYPERLRDRLPVLRRALWTEYSLYYLFAELSGALESDHVPAGEGGRPMLISSGSIWEERQLDALDGEGLLAEDDALFSVVQSNTHVDPARVERIVEAHLARSPRDSS